MSTMNILPPPKTRPIPVRFRAEEIRRLNSANKRMGLDNRSAIVRLAVHIVLPQIEAGQIKIPDSFAAVESGS